MNEEKIILCGNLDKIENLINSFTNLSKYIYCIVGDSIFLDLNDYKIYDNFQDCFNELGCNHKIVVSDEMYFEKFKKELLQYEINLDNIILLRVWLLNMLKQHKDIIIRPTFIRLEICTMCQLNCLDCYMRKNHNGTAGWGYLSFDKFKKFIDDNDFIKEIEISNSGEVFLNPDINKILEYAYQKKINIYIDNGTNFNNVSEETIENLVKYDVKRISFSIDGASQRTYSIYRRNGNFDRVINNIKLLNYYKEKYNSQNPVLKWQYILMRHNICDIKKAKIMSNELNMELFFKKDWGNSYKPINPDIIFQLTGLDYTNNKILSKYNYNFCEQLFYNPQINFDGRLLGCCDVYLSDWKLNVFSDGLINCLNSDYYRNGIYRLLGDEKAFKNDDPCCQCHRYKEVIENKLWVNI